MDLEKWQPRLVRDNIISFWKVKHDSTAATSDVNMNNYLCSVLFWEDQNL